MLLCGTPDRAFIYTGVTTNVVRRYHEHVSGDGAKFTAANPPFRLLRIEGPLSEGMAKRRENAIKGLTRKQKEHLVGGLEIPDMPNGKPFCPACGSAMMFRGYVNAMGPFKYECVMHGPKHDDCWMLE